MPDIDPFILRCMHDEVVKVAFLGSLARQGVQAVGKAGGKLLANKGVQSAGRHVAQSVGDVGAGMGVGAASGGLIGAGTEGYKGYQEEGASGAVSRGLQGGMRGAGLGAAMGGVAGLASGGRATVSELGKTLTKGKYNPLGTAVRTGQRNLHSVTGLAPGGAKRGTKEYANALRGMKMEGWKAKGTAQAAAKTRRQAEQAVAKSKRKVHRGEKNLERAIKSGDPAAIRKAERSLARDSRAIHKGEKAVGKATDALDRASEEAKSVEDAWQAGMTSLPGVAGAVKEKGVGSLWEHGIKPQTKTLSGKAMLAAPVALAAPTLATEEDEEGRGRAERFSKSLVENAAYTTTPMIPLVGSDIMGRSIGAAAGLGGRNIDKLIGAVKRKPTSELGESPGVPATDGDSEGGIPVERVVSNAAQGKPPEDMLV
jgi:hypothetical protein